MISNDPGFESKAADVIGLYLSPPAHAAVFCVDEKTDIQALDRKDRMLPLSPGRAQSHSFEYKRNGKQDFYCPLKSNRKVDDCGGARPYYAVNDLQWSGQDAKQGKLIKFHGFPGAIKVKLFRVAVTTTRTEWIVTNDIDQASTGDTREICAIRWKIEQYHRAVKKTLGIEKCQCRSAIAQGNHISCVILAWNHLTQFAMAPISNIYSVKRRMLSAYMKQELRLV
jgi:hypothetical protein